MITDEEVVRIAKQNGGVYDPASCSFGFYESIELINFARAIYQLGRQHQRESDVALCSINGGGLRGAMVAEAIRQNTGELK